MCDAFHDRFALARAVMRHADGIVFAGSDGISKKMVKVIITRCISRT